MLASFEYGRSHRGNQKLAKTMVGDTPKGLERTGLIDLDRYPLHRLNSATGQELVRHCRAELDAHVCCSLPGFVPSVVLEAMAEESCSVAKHAFYSRRKTNVYFSTDDPSYPEDHPKRRFFHRTSAFVPADCFPEESLLRKLYKWPGFMPFVQECLGEEGLYEYADPLADVILNVLNPDQEFPWHFDTNEFSVSLLTQAAETGGVFEYCPNLRSGNDENYEAVLAVLNGDRRPVRSLTIHPGDLQIFKGRHSMHRVTRVSGTTPRYMAIFSYAREPNMVGKVERMLQLYGKVLPIHYEAEKRYARADALED